MNGTMMEGPLLLTHFLDRAGTLFAEREIVSRMVDGSVHRTNYGELRRRARRLAAALRAAGIRKGDRVATLAWNHYRHLEAYFGVPAAGAVLHTLNLRLFPEQLAYIVNHARDRALLVDESLLPLVEEFRARTPTLERVIVMASDSGKWRGRGRGRADYEGFLAKSERGFEYPKARETDALAMCYTSGTTGEPKGVVYTHRSACLHSLAVCTPDALGIGMRETVMPISTMFHANAWGLPFAAAASGAKLVFSARDLSPSAVAGLIRGEGVTLAAGVPTIWSEMLAHLDREPGGGLSKLHTIVCGGSAVPRHLMEAYEARFGVRVLQIWGMTETSPMATVSRVKPGLPQEPGPAHYDVRAKQGIPLPFVEVAAAGEGGAEVLRDGKAVGDLLVRGPWVTNGYYRNPKATKAAVAPGGWLRTGDVAAIDADGYVRITDRTKDLIKSGGEWISSVDLENALMAHPAVAEACVVAIPDLKWDERPLACVVLRPGAAADERDLQAHLAARFAKWQLPDRYEFVAEVPKTSVGKFDKKVLRARFAE